MKDFKAFIDIVNSDDFIEKYQQDVEEIDKNYEHEDVIWEEVLERLLTITEQYTISALRSYHEWVNRSED